MAVVRGIGGVLELIVEGACGARARHDIVKAPTCVSICQHTSAYVRAHMPVLEHARVSLTLSLSLSVSVSDTVVHMPVLEHGRISLSL